MRSGVRTLAAGAALLVTSCLAAGSAGAQEDGYPRVLRVDASQPQQVELDVVVPPLLARQPLPASAFRVTENSRPLHITSVTRRVPVDLRVVLILATAVPPAVLAAEQGAAREFVFGLPPLAQVGVVAADPEPGVVAPLDPDRGAVTRALVGLQRQPATSSGAVTSAIGLALTQLSGGPGLNVVVAVDSQPVATELPAAVSRAARTSGATIYPITLRAPPSGYLGGLPAGSGGRVLPIDDPKELQSAYDVVASELVGRYRVGFRPTAGGHHTADLTVSSAGVRGTTAFSFDSGMPATGDANRPAGRSDNGTRDRSGGILIKVLAGLAALVLLAALTWRFAHRS